jgi:DNA-binding NtrC family response regulator
MGKENKNMKKILLIGKMNEITQDIYAYLSRTYSVQLCVDNGESVRGMLRINHPDLIMISLVGFDDGHIKIFNEIQHQCSTVPLIVIGTINEYKAFSGAVNPETVHYLERPVDMDKILQECQRCLQERPETNYFNVQKEVEERKPVFMMVDDSALSLRSMKRILEPKYKTILVTNGAQAITMIDKHSPDLIILDYEMPVCNGERIFKLLKANDATKNIPVIFLTGVSDKDNILAVLKLNPAGYFLKPPAADKLLSKIEEILG